MWKSTINTPLNWCGWLGAIALLFLEFPALAGELRQWQYDPLETELELTLDGEITPRYWVLENPLRIVVELPNTEIQGLTEQNSYSGSVQQISLERSSSEQTLLILYLSPGVKLAPESVAIATSPTADGLSKTVIRPLIMPGNSTVGMNLPPATFEPPANQPLVSVPPLFPRSQPQAAQTEDPTPGASAASLVTQPASVETTPDLVGMRGRSQLEASAPTADIPPIGSTVIPVIQFGQDWPSSNPQRTIAQASHSFLPAGTRLKLRYPGQESLVLTPGIPLQEVLIVEEAISDRQGTLLIPVGTAVIGQFQTQGQQSRFQATALVLGSEGTFPIQGQSDRLNSPIVEPGQVIEIRLGR